MVRFYGQVVAALVFRVAGMAFYPVEGYAVALVGGIEAEPQVHILFALDTG